MKNVEYLGQVFTPDSIVKEMLELKKNTTRTLEPSCGDGAFLKHLSGEAVGIEYDTSICPSNALNIDFFDYSIEEKFDTIIGNPPYVKYKSINDSTKEKISPYIKKKIFDERTNLYMFFIEKSIHHLNHKGELIFIVPRDFFKASSAVNLNKILYENGTITYIKDFGDKVIFPGFCPNCIIFRFEKGNHSKRTIIDGEEFIFKEVNGQLIFSKHDYPIEFSDLFFVKVGAVSGCDDAFIQPTGATLMVNSSTRESGQLKKVFYNTYAKELEPFKEKLLGRKIRSFTENNWYHWGRGYFESDLPRIYVNAKTRKKSPFFINECKAFDGSILAIFLKDKKNTNMLDEICKELNNVNWYELGFQCDGRYLFSQHALENTVLPKVFQKFK